MQNIEEIGQIVIVGGGPVGNFIAVMVAMLGVKSTVYEKRDSYTRQINLKIEKDFFQQVYKVIGRISRRQRQFFDKINTSINNNNGKILLKDLQINLKQQAVQLGVNYVKKQLKTFQQVQLLHKQTKPLILDCTGRNSFLRVNKFGSDDKNMQIFNLHHALHLNFKANIPKNFDFKLIYPVIKNNQNLKLGSIVVSKRKQKQNNKYSHITVPLFISDTLSDIIDQKYPTINRNPLKPFSIKEGESQIVKQVQQVIYSLFCALAMQNWDIQWSDIVLKKINITCGYGIKRSQNRYICLGDSAAHFAYFKSLNFGLRHAFQLVKILSSYHSLKYNLGPFDQKTIVNRCWKKNPLLWPVKAREGPSAAEYFITNSQVGILAPYLYDIRNDRMSRIDLLPQISQQKIQQKFQAHLQQKREKNWIYYLNKFEDIRQKDVKAQIMSNRTKKTGSQIVSYFIWLNSLSPIKFSQTVSFVTNGYYLEKKDFDYFGSTVHEILTSVLKKKKFASNIQQRTAEILKAKKGQLPFQYEHFFKQVNNSCQRENFTYEQFCKTVSAYQMKQQTNKHKQAILFFKALQIIAHIIGMQIKQQQNKQKQQQFVQI